MNQRLSYEVLEDIVYFCLNSHFRQPKSGVNIFRWIFLKMERYTELDFKIIINQKNRKIKIISIFLKKILSSHFISRLKEGVMNHYGP